jgi:pimeloyl-ACP methyl ester carboxylesterase
MMAQRDLPALAADLPRRGVPLKLIVGDCDGTIPPQNADRVGAILPATEVSQLPGLGHLAQEKNRHAIAAMLLLRLMQRV